MSKHDVNVASDAFDAYHESLVKNGGLRACDWEDFYAGWQSARSQEDPVAWINPDDPRDVISDIKKHYMERIYVIGGAQQTYKYSVPLYTHPAQPADGVPESHVVIHEYTARMALVALEEFTDRIRRGAVDEPEPEEHYYGVQAIDDLENALSQPPKREDADNES